MKSVHLVTGFILCFTTLCKTQNIDIFANVNKQINKDLISLEIKLTALQDVVVMFNYDIFCPLDSHSLCLIDKELLKSQLFIDSLTTGDFLIENEKGEIKYYSSNVNKERFFKRFGFENKCSGHPLEPVLMKTEESFRIKTKIFKDDLKIKPSDAKIRLYFILNVNGQNDIIKSNWIKI